MKLKVVVIDLELSRRARRVVSVVSLALLFVCVGAIAFASVPHTWNDGDTLTAADLNGNFADVDARVTALEQSPRVIVTPWMNYAPMVTEGGVDAGGTQGTVAFWRRVGDTMEVKLATTFTSCAHDGQVNWSLPNGEVIDLAKTERSEAMGSAVGFGPGTSGMVKLAIVTNIAPIAPGAVAVDLADAQIGGATCASVGAGGAFRLNFHTPVQGWTVTGP